MIHKTRFDPAKQGMGYLPVHYSDGTLTVYTFIPDCNDSKRAMLLDINQAHSVSLLVNGAWSRQPGKAPSIQRVDCLDQLWESYGGFFQLKKDPDLHTECEILLLFNAINVNNVIGAARHALEIIRGDQ